VPRNGIVQWPSIAARSDTIFIVGNVFRGDSLGARPAYLGRLRQSGGGNLIALPPVEFPRGDFLFAYPRIVAAGGKLHLIWAEFATRPQTPTAWQQATYLGKSLWHAALDDGAWSAPEQIASGDALGWSDEVGAVAVGADGILHVVAWKGDNGTVPHVNEFRLIAGHWESSILPYTGLNPATALATRGDTIAIALVDERLDTARVMVLESTDHGMHWTNPLVASRRPRLEGTVTRLSFATTDAALILAIGEKAANSFQLDTIRTVRLEGSRGLSAPRFVPPPPAADQFVLTGTSCGPVIMLTRSLSAKPQVIQVTIPSKSMPTVSRPLLGQSGFSVFPGIIAARRSVIAVFTYNSETGARAQTAAMTLSVCPP
jgi:hypothetical protein